jgi:hypothetical protein
MQTMTHSEFVYWVAKHGIEPIGDSRADLRAGIVAAQIHNSNITKRKDAKTPVDFMPFHREQPKPEFDKVAFFKNLNKYAVRKK